MPEAAEPLRRRVRARALRGLTSASRIVPAPALDAGLACLSGLMRFSRYDRRVRENLELALGSETSAAERDRIARGVRRHSARLLAEWLRLARGDRAATSAWLEHNVDVAPSISILEELARGGRGPLVVTAHIGNWEVLAAMLKHRGFDGQVVGRQRARDSSSDWLVEMRRAYGVESLPQDTSPRRLLEALRAGRLLGVLADLEVRRLAGEFVPFFGVPALTMTAPAALARAARLPLVPVRCTLVGGRYRLAVEPPLHLDRELDRRAAARDLLVRLNAVFERWIREAPEQWAWHQPRWRTRPDEARDHARPLLAR